MPINPMLAKDLFLAILDLPVAERAAHLDRACQGDAALRERVEAMVRAHETSGELMSRPVGEMLAAAAG